MTMHKPDMLITFEDTGIVIESNITSAQTTLWHSLSKMKRLSGKSRGFTCSHDDDGEYHTAIVEFADNLTITAAFNLETGRIVSFTAQPCNGVKVSAEQTIDDTWNVTGNEYKGRASHFSSNTGGQITSSAIKPRSKLITSKTASKALVTQEL